MKRNSDVQPGDKVELADKETSFLDRESDLDISRTQIGTIGDRVGKKTHTAILSGRLLVVGGKKKTRNLGEGATDTDADQSTEPSKGGKKKAEATEE